MTSSFLKRVRAADLVPRQAAGLDAETLAGAASIVADVRREGLPAVLRYAARFDAWREGTPWLYDRADLQRALGSIGRGERGVLERTAERIASFAQVQRGTLTDVTTTVAGGVAGHQVIPMDRAGCYAPAGRFPLPSSLLMTAVTARVAGVREVIVASPSPGSLMLAAAAVADADAFLAVGGAQAIAALAYGIGVAPCDIVVGPGNRWITAAKRSVAGDVAIDMLAGPSELVVVADAGADPATIAADLLAQAEHDPDAFTALITTDAAMVAEVERELAVQLETLPTAPVARASLAHGMAIVCASADEAVRACDVLAPEHLQLSLREPEAFAARVRHAGACFIGERSAEVFGDYGAGGNHVLPTGRGARFTGGLSVLTFLRVRSWLRFNQSAGAALVADVATLARLEGLEAHARAAERRAR